MALLTTNDIITKFGLYFGDDTSLSTQEALDLCQKKYDDILQSEEWEFLKTSTSGSTSGNTLAQPADFDRMTVNQYIYIGTGNNIWQQVPYEQRRNFTNSSGYFYYDAKNEQFVFMVDPNNTYSFDYIYTPPALDLAGSNPVFPTRFYDMIYQAMLIDADIINMSDKARSYAAVNNSMYQAGLADMKSWNKKLSGYNHY